MSADQPSASRSHLVEIDEVWQTLMRLGNRGSSRFEFMREASVVLLKHTSASFVDVWAQDHGVLYRWHAVMTPRPAFTLTNLAQPGGGPAERELLAQVIGWLGDEDFSRRARRSARGSLWCSDERSGSSEAQAQVPGSRAMLSFSIDGRNRGVLQIVANRLGLFDEHTIECLEDLGRALGAAMANRRAQFALGERVKELTCMYRIAQLASEPGDLDETLQRIVELLPPAWQYPEITNARVTLDGRAFVSRGFDAGPHRLAATITVDGVERGEVEVFYNERCREHEEIRFHDHQPFLAEEHFLIEGVARELRSIIERAEAAEEREVLQEQIRRQERLATIGKLTAGVAHELNEPLGNILGFAQLALKNDLPDQVSRDLQRIEKASLFAREIIRKLMLFSRQTPARKSAVDLNKVIEDSLSLLEARCHKSGIALHLRFDRELPSIQGDPAQLQQVVVNIALNAIQAMPDGGTLTFITLATGQGVALVCEDTGVGMDADVREKIFLPFFTTKDVGEGTGLGLSVVHGIVAAHGGSIAVTSEPGRGSRFEIELPAGAAPDSGARQRRQEEADA